MRNRDKNGNLLSEVATRYRKDYVYNAQNRMIFSDVQDAFLNTRNLTEYAYDAFGRRIETIEYLGDSTRNLYDGFSFDVVGKTLLQTRSAPAMTEQKYRAGSAGHPELGSGFAAAGRSGAGVANGTRYRYIGDENLVPLEQAGGNAGAQASSSAGAAAKTRSRPNSEYVLYSNGEPVAVNSDNGVSYFGTDILGSVRSVTDRNGQVKASYEYDAFGTPYLSNLENDVGFGYCGKVYDSATGLYDYGFRDYSPNSARFTTVDPVRDGANWFSYVVNDPVNYIDPFGLTSTDAGNGNSPKITFSSDIIQQTYIGDTQFNFSIDVSQLGAEPSQNVTFSLVTSKPSFEFTLPTITPESFSQSSTNSDWALTQEEFDSIIANSNTEPSGWDYDSVMNYLSQGNIPGQYGAPTDSRRVTSPVCSRSDAYPPEHTGIDIGALKPGVKGDPIYAVADGIVTRVGISNPKTNTTRLEQSLPHTKDTAVYMHADFIVKDGESVKKGQIIGYMSDNGSEGQVHLHFEIRKDGIYVQEAALAEDPLKHLPSSYYIE